MTRYTSSSLPIIAACGIWTTTLLSGMSVLAQPAAQPAAWVAAIEHLTEKRVGENGAWTGAKVGTRLELDNRVRTRKRSKADILFTDKSLIRLGPLSTLFIEGPTSAKLAEGALLFSRLTPGRIVAGAGIAGIKGSVGIIALNADGSARFTLYSGAMDVDTTRGDHLVLPPGHTVLVLADGSLSALRVSGPLMSSGDGSGIGVGSAGGTGSGLGTAPVNSPFAGSPANITARLAPERVAGDQGATASNSVVAQNADPFQQPTGGALPADPPILVFPAFRRAGAAVTGGLGTFTSALAAPSGAMGGNSGTPAAATGRLAAEMPGEGAAQDHMADAFNGSGVSGVTDLELIASKGNGPTYATGGRLHSFVTKGNWSADVAFLPLSVHSAGLGGTNTRDVSAMSSANVTYANDKGTIVVGRQRFLAGPTQASLFGSLVRQGARDTMDAVRISPNVGKGRQLELAYLLDAFPTNLPYRVSGQQNGLYARYGVQTARANFGINLLNYRNLPVSTTTGASLDLVVPLQNDQVELYGEVGRDPFRRDINTVGLTFPGLYQATDFDVYAECATMRRGNSTAPIPPTEYALRVYRKLGNSSNLVAQLQSFYRAQTTLTVGVSWGARVPFSGN